MHITITKGLDVRHPEEVFEVAGVRQGLLVAPRTEKKDLGGARPDNSCDTHAAET